MNKIKLAYVRWRNTSRWYNRRKYKNKTVEDVFFSVKETNSYRGWIHNFLVLYKAVKLHPDSKALKVMFNNTYLHLHNLKGKWKFAKEVYKDTMKRWGLEWKKKNGKN